MKRTCVLLFILVSVEGCDLWLLHSLGIFFIFLAFLKMKPGVGHSVLEWVSMCVRKSEWKGAVFGAVSIRVSKSAKCDKGHIFHKKILNKMMPERVFFTVWHSKRGRIFQLRAHSDRILEVLDAHVYPRNGWVAPPHPGMNLTLKYRIL